MREIAIAEQSGYAKYLGKKPPAGIVQIMDVSSALVHVPLQEAFGLVVAEGLARQLFLFAFKEGGIVDIAGFLAGTRLFDQGDYYGLENGIRRWLEEGAPKAPPSTPEQIEAQYHPRVIAGRHLAIYRQVLSSNNSA